MNAVADPLGRAKARPEDDTVVARAPSQDDALLVAAIRAGDRGAEEELYRRHAGPALGLACRLLNSRDEALDVLQDAFVTVFESLGDLREPAAFRSWLARVVIHLVHRRFRRRRFLGLLGLGRPSDEATLEALADPAIAPEARAELRLLDRTLADIPDHERAAWMLRHVEGFSLEEVADACRCSLATAKRRIAAADSVVRAHFADGGDR